MLLSNVVQATILIHSAEIAICWHCAYFQSRDACDRHVTPHGVLVHGQLPLVHQVCVSIQRRRWCCCCCCMLFSRVYRRHQEGTAIEIVIRDSTLQATVGLLRFFIRRIDISEARASNFAIFCSSSISSSYCWPSSSSGQGMSEPPSHSIHPISTLICTGLCWDFIVVVGLFRCCCSCDLLGIIEFIFFMISGESLRHDVCQ